MAQAPDEGPHLTHDGVGDHARHVAEEAPSPIGDPGRAFDVGIARGRADGQHVGVEADVVQFAHGIDVDQHRGTREAKPHGRDQTLPAGEHAGLGPVLLQVLARLVQRVSPEVLEGCWHHVSTSCLGCLSRPRARGRRTNVWWKGRSVLRVRDGSTLVTPMISAVVLAAGASTRMGVQKLLLPLGDQPIVRRTVRQICDAGFDEVVVVVGHEWERVVAALEGLPIRHVLNPAFATGMGSSFRTAVEHLSDSAAAMFALADQPFVTTNEYRAVLEAYTPGAPAIVSVRYGDVTAPPHLFSREFFPELAQLQHGARSVLERHRDQTTVLPFPPDLLMDIDTPEDYQNARFRGS